MSRYSHNSACTVRNENIVRNKNRNFGIVNRVNRPNAVEQNACFILGNLCTLKVGLTCRSFLISADFVHIAELVRPLFDKRMLRRNYHICSTVECVGSGGIDCQSIACGCGKVNLCACASANPVSLLSLNSVGIINQIKVVNKSVGILGDFEHPLRFNSVNNLAAAALAHAVDNFLVSENALTRGTPVNVHFLLIGKSVLKELNKNPLSPLVVVGICGVDLSAPVKGDTERLNLLFETRDIVLCYNLGVNVIFYSVVFSGQTERIPSDRIKNIIALKSALSRYGIKRCVRTRMSYV